MNDIIDVSAIITLIKDFDYEMLDDSEWDELLKVDSSNDEQMLKIFNQVTVPEYEAMDMTTQRLIKDSLQGMLSTDFDFQQILGRIDTPFDPIEEPENFFSVLWLALFKERISN
ncbi:hypothetical protein J8L98_14755 [Pseudoalteromonas sp. MMG013]|uniref:hypothetical protein n=1 Tax=Pseudoalteromonas sp. MMG013 TaxID=2822687 RepID=UPI001B3757F3|nr:hypothetical protein [Pseudoalteromonas sp. MMG013]MBQ4862945.1 hypothetical protein [Pseudoalteromonas sp. MMG013]